MIRSGSLAALTFVGITLLGMAASADEKSIVLDTVPPELTRLKVAPDGNRVYMASPKEFAVFDAEGRRIDRIGVPNACRPRDLIPLPGPDGGFLSCTAYANGHLALCRPDGSEIRTLVGKGQAPNQLRADSTAWTSPHAAVVDVARRRIYAVDTTNAPAGKPDPDWSRIAIFDFDGKFLGDLLKFDGAAPADDSLRTWYNDIALSPSGDRLYLLARRTAEVWAVEVGSGRITARAPAGGGGDGNGGLATLPDGRVAVGAGRDIQIFAADLKPIRTIPGNAGLTLLDVESDAAGRLYVVVNDPSITFLKFSPDFTRCDVLGPRFTKILVDFPGTAALAGRPMTFRVSAQGRPTPSVKGGWRVWARPADGSSLTWTALPATLSGNQLSAPIPRTFLGLYEIGVRLGDDAIDRGNPRDDPMIVKTVSITRSEAAGSVAVIPTTGRTAFRQGETIALQVVARGDLGTGARIKLDLQHGETTLGSEEFALPRTGNASVELGAAWTRRLAPGRYRLVPSGAKRESYSYTFDIAPAFPDSPMQRLLYHEFETTPITAPQADLTSPAEKLAFIEASARAASALGFTRETDRRLGQLDRKTEPIAWRRDLPAADTGSPAAAPPTWKPIPTAGGSWETEHYLDRAAAYGLSYDTQLLVHCAGVRFRDEWLHQLVPTLQRGIQWMGRYPAFRGVNLNDEMFFGGFATEWTPEDDQWLKVQTQAKFARRPHADLLDFAVRRMYDRFEQAITQARPQTQVTATPMWQFPAVEGSYAPVVYQGMHETYSHFLSEGYHLPFYAPHSVDFLRRPGLPLRGVFETPKDRHELAAELYAKNAMQVLARGVQGVGVQHTRPFEHPEAADAHRVVNALAKTFGGIFAEAPAANEAAVLYSRTQDITETRNSLGTPHWERVYMLHAAGLMAGVPMRIVYEEDIAAGWLLDGKAPRLPMLLFTGQRAELPAPVRDAIGRFVAAGGKVFTDADSAAFPKATRTNLKAHTLKQALNDGYAADTVFPLLQPLFETLAKDVAATLGPHRRFAFDADDLWVSKNQLDGGAVRYLMVASETSPYPWSAGAVWSLGALYSGSWLPRTVTLRFPLTPNAVVYDVFDQAKVAPKLNAGRAELAADLTTFPGRLYAVVPSALGPPSVDVSVQGDAVRVLVWARNAGGKVLAGRVPLRIRLVSKSSTALELFRATGVEGAFQVTIPLPATETTWTIEVTELLGGQGSAVEIPTVAMPKRLLAARPEVDLTRPDRIASLLETARTRGGLILAASDSPALLNATQIKGLETALKTRGVTLQQAKPDSPGTPKPGVYLAAGILKGPDNQPRPLNDLLQKAATHGLFDPPLTEQVPGPGRGLVSAVFAPRDEDEHVITLIGTDPAGLEKAVEAWIAWLKQAPPSTSAKPTAAETPGSTVQGKPAKVAPLARLSDRVGAPLSGITPAAGGKHLLVAADGWLNNNLAVVVDEGTSGKVERVGRVGQGPTTTSAWISADGKRFGASGRVTSRWGQEFTLFGEETASDVFTSFGDTERFLHRFGVGQDGNLVVAPGPYGAVCWTRQGTSWREAWAVDVRKDFPKLDWPIAETAERQPQFHAVVPESGDVAYLLHGDFTPNNWITPENSCGARLLAVDLKDGKPRWSFEVPIPKTLLFPKLHTSPSGKKVAVEAQIGSWRTERFQLYIVENGKASGSWPVARQPLSVAVSEVDSAVAYATYGRLFEVRGPEGRPRISRLWPDQPVSVAFAADGKGVLVADDAGRLTRLDSEGRTLWQTHLGSLLQVTTKNGRIYTAGRDGRLRAIEDTSGTIAWTLDLTPALRGREPDPLAGIRTLADASKARIRPVRPSTASPQAPAGPDLLRSRAAVLTVGGTKGWMSEGTVQIRPEALTDNRADGPPAGWQSLDELFWNTLGGRQVWAEITFPTARDVKSLTVREDTRHPEAYPTDAVIQVWDEANKNWATAARGTFLDGPVNTYALDRKGVTKLRYAPLGPASRNLFTSEIEVR